MYDFNYHRPASIAEAKTLFANADEPIYLAGGHTLVPAMKQRLNAPSDVIDLGRIGGLDGIRRDGDRIVIGALARHAAVASSETVATAIPALAALAAGIGDAQVRNRGTIGGSVANSDPAADYPAAVVGLGATVITDNREIAADDFFTGMFETALARGELVTAIAFPVADAAAYVKFPNPASRYATVGVFVSRRDRNVRVAITGAAPSVFRCRAYEAALTANFAAAALDGIPLDAGSLNSDLHASSEYRAHLCRVMTQRAVAELQG